MKLWIMNMKKINVFSIPNCPFCVDIKNKLRDANISFNDIDVSLDENEKEFEEVIKISGNDSVPTITVGKHLLAPNVNFHSIDEAFELINYILDNED